MAPHLSSSQPLAGASARCAQLALFLICALVVALANSGAYLAMAAALVAIVLFAASWRVFPLRRAPFPLLFASAFALIALATVLGAGAGERFLYLLDFSPLLMAAVLYWILAVSPREILLRLIALGSLVGVGLGLVTGLYEVVVLGEPRANGFGGSAIYYGNFSLLLGFLALAPYFSKEGGAWYLGLAPVMAVCAALLSGSRATVIVGVALLVVLLVHVLLSGRIRVSVPRLLALGAGLILAAAAGLALSGSADRMIDMFSTLGEIARTGSTSDMSIALRLDFYQGGLKAFAESPWIGHGWHQGFDAAARFMTIPEAAERAPGAVGHLHNDALNFAVAFGVFGVGAYLAMLLAPLVHVLAARRRADAMAPSYAVWLLVVTFAVAGLPDVNFLYEAPKVLFAFLGAGLAAFGSASEADARS